MSDQIRVDRGAIQSHADGTRSNMGNLRGLNDDVDSRQAQLLNQLDGGMGTDEQSRTRTGTRHAARDIDANVNRNTNRTAENADEFIGGVRAEAAKSLRTFNG